MPLKIGLDWDGTVNADPTTFREVVCSFLDAGHEVVVVTWRCDPRLNDEPWSTHPSKWEDIEAIFSDWGFRIPIVYCNGKAKRDFYHADIWIDDNPAAVSFSLTRAPRFEEDPMKYNQDILVCSREGFEDVFISHGQLKGVA